MASILSRPQCVLMNWSGVFSESLPEAVAYCESNIAEQTTMKLFIEIRSVY